MKRCESTVLCSVCPLRKKCPSDVRRDKRKRRPLSDSASKTLLKRAATVLSEGWYSCERLGKALYGEPKPGTTGRMSIMVRARRPINKMLKLGVLAVRQNGSGVAEYTAVPGWEEVMP